MSEQLNIAELRRLHVEASPGESAALVPAVLAALPALLDAAEERAALAADLAAAETAISALDCHYGATEELGHDCHDATPCMREMLEAAAEERDRLKAKMAAVDCRDDAQCDTPRRCSEDRPCQWHLLTAQCFDARMAWSKERTENFSLKAKLAALVEAVEYAVDFVNHSSCTPMCGIYRTTPTECTCGIDGIRAALDAAKVQL